MSRSYITAAAAALTLALSSSVGFAQENAGGQAGGESGGAGQGEATTFDMDTPKDAETAYSDFATSWDEWGTYDRWDADADGVLSREEFNRGVFSQYDLDRDDILDDDEFVTMQNDRFFADVTDPTVSGEEETTGQ